jgi:RND family efflux transporter MFP subunit
VRRLAYFAVALLAIALGALVAARIRRAEPTLGAAPKVVERPRATGGQEGPTRGFTGVIFPREQVDVASSVEARLEQVKVQPGSKVAKGDVIATLDAESLRRELKAAAATVRAAQAEARAASVEHDAASEKVARLNRFAEAVPGEERVNAAFQEKMSATRISAARARVSEAVARVDQLRLLIEVSAVVAPFAGVVAARYVDPGAQVGPGRPIARIISADDLWVRFAIPEERAGEARIGSCATVTTSSPPVQASAVVETLTPQVDTELRLLLAEARLTNPAEWNERLQAGLAADVVIVACTTP